MAEEGAEGSQGAQGGQKAPPKTRPTLENGCGGAHGRGGGEFPSGDGTRSFSGGLPFSTAVLSVCGTPVVPAEERVGVPEPRQRREYDPPHVCRRPDGVRRVGGGAERHTGGGGGDLGGNGF